MTDQNFTIEAEDFDNLQGFDVFDGNNASGGQLVRANRNDVRLSTEFTGESGTYDYTTVSYTHLTLPTTPYV